MWLLRDLSEVKKNLNHDVIRVILAWVWTLQTENLHYKVVTLKRGQPCKRCVPTCCSCWSPLIKTENIDFKMRVPFGVTSH